MLFIALGGFTVFWGLFVIWWLPDSPMRATVRSSSASVSPRTSDTLRFSAFPKKTGSSSSSESVAT